MANPSTSAQILQQLGDQIDGLASDDAATKSDLLTVHAALTALQMDDTATQGRMTALENKVVPATGATTDLTAVNAAITDLQAKVSQLMGSASPNALAAALISIIGPNGIKIDGVISSGGAAGGTAGGAMGGSTGGTGATGGGPTTGAPGTGGDVGGSSDTNVYPFTLPANRKAGDTTTLGTGPNQIDLYLSSNPNNDLNDVVILVNGRAVVAPDFQVMSHVGLGKVGNDHLVLKGPWGSNPLVQIKGVAPGGINGLWMNGATIDFVDLVANGVYDSRGGNSVNATLIFISNGADMTLTLPVPVAPVVTVPAATPTLINGQTLSQQMAAGPLTLSAGTIVGTGLAKSNVTGAGMGQTIIDGTNLEPTQDKALIVLGANGITISQLTIKNAWINASLGLNAAGLRNADSTIGITASNVEITGCQNGILTDDASSVDFVLDKMNIHGCGATGNPGNTHSLYIGGLPTTKCTLTNSVLSGCIDAHEYKSRCGTTISQNNKFTTGGFGSCIDCSNGGILNSTDDTFTLPAGAADETFISFAQENTKNAATGHACNITNGVFHDGTGTGGIINSGDPAAVLTLVGCTYTGAVAPRITGWGQVIGSIAKATAQVTGN